jgi:hypothetical protein
VLTKVGPVASKWELVLHYKFKLFPTGSSVCEGGAASKMFIGFLYLHNTLTYPY